MGKTIFKSEPLIDWSKEEERTKLSKALREVRGNLGALYHPIIAGKRVRTVSRERIVSKNPSNPDEIIGRVCVAGKEQADKAISTIQHADADKKWARTPPKERADVLRRMAQIFRKRRYFFIALGMLEVGKTALEMDGEVAEGIDFLEYYAACALVLVKINQESLLQPPGEKNTGVYEPLGIGVSIQPWNFPFAISVGPAAAALVMGNSILYKPAEQSSIMGYYIADVFYEAGIPKEMFHYLPGYGADQEEVIGVGNYLANHSAVRFISFTGSRTVADLMEKAVFKFNHETIYTLRPELRFRKQIATLEAGGKNAIIVDSDADVDEAVLAVSDSAFGFGGQKCSACSRLIIVDDKDRSSGLYDMLTRRLAERVEGLPVGSPEDSSNQFGPLIDKSAYKKVTSYVKIAEEEGTVFAKGKVPQGSPETGYFVPPMIVTDLAPDSRMAQEEIFGPVLSVFRVSTFEKALELANNTEFGLTGGVISRNPEHVALAEREFMVGNLYINRKSTGAMPARQPFGGIRQSGNGTKAGGWDYLLNFVQRKNISENTMRHGAVIE